MKKIDYGSDSDTNSIMTQAGKIMGMIRNIAIIASVIIIMVLGIKYMLGSVEEKAEYKKSFYAINYRYYISSSSIFNSNIYYWNNRLITK